MSGGRERRGGRAGSPPPDRIAVVGVTSSGKTTLARSLARLLGSTCLELDAIYWQPGWTPPEPELFREQVTAALAGDRWVVDGSYRNVREIIWTRAQMVVWLDYSLPLVFSRLLRRTLGRLLTREPLFNGNRESWRMHFLSRRSLFLWLLQTHGRYRREYRQDFAQSQYAQLRIVRLPSPKATRRWLAHIGAGTAAGR